MLAQTEDFEAKLKTLPGLRTKVYRKKPPKADDEVTKTANKAEGEEPAQPVFD